MAIVTILILLLLRYCVSFPSNRDSNSLSWTQENPKLTPAFLTSLTYGLEQYVIAGASPDQGIIILESNDLSNWNIIVTGLDGYVSASNNIAYLQDIGFVVSSGEGSLAFSSDLDHWEITPTSPSSFVTSLVAANGLFLCAFDEWTFLGVSTDGRNWNFSVEVSGYYNPGGVAFGAGGYFLAYGTDNSYPVIYRSKDAFNWELAHNLTELIPYGEYYSPTFISGGEGSDFYVTLTSNFGDALLFYSGENDEWQVLQVFNHPYFTILNMAVSGSSVFLSGYYADSKTSLNLVSTDSGNTFKNNTNIIGNTFYSNGAYISVGEFGLIQVSNDGISWSTLNEGIVGNTDTFFFSEYFNSFVLNSGTGIYVSKDALNWNLVSTYGVTNLVWNSELGIFYGMYDSNLVTSKDLITWETRGNSGSCYPVNFAYSASVAKWVVTCNSQHSHFTTGRIFLSTDSTGNLFTQTSFTDIDESILNVVTNGQIFVTSDAFYVYTSNDGMNWSQTFQFPEYNYGETVYVGGKFFFITPVVIYVSDDGRNWEVTNVNATAISYASVSGSMVYVATGMPGQFYTSSDAVTWTMQEDISPIATILYFASFGNNFPVVAVSGYNEIFVSNGS